MKNWIDKTKKWISGLKSEIKKVVWPTPKKLFTNAAASVAAILVTAAAIFGFDALSQLFVKAALIIVG